MIEGSEKEDKEVVITLLSNGSTNLFKDNTLTLFSNRLHTPIILNPSNHNYVALQEIGISLNSGNIRIPYEKPAIIYFEWDTAFRNHSEDLGRDEIKKKNFVNTYNQNKNTFFINYPNNFGIYSKKSYIENKVYTQKTIEEELKNFDFFLRDNVFPGKLEINLMKQYQETKSGNLDLWYHCFEIKRYTPTLQEITLSQNKVIGLIIHKKLAEALKIDTYLKSHLIDHSSHLEIPDLLEIDSEPYLLYFINENEIIKGRIILENKIMSNDHNVINIDCNIVDPYISNTKFCNTIATFNNITNKQNFLYYYPNNRTFYKLRGNEIDSINIKISDKDYNQLNLFEGIPTIVKLIIKSKIEMDFTSNIQVSSNAPGISHFYNKNSYFRVALPSNEVFQAEKSQLSISSITYPNRFKVLPKYLNSNIITKIYLYSNQNVILGEMEIFSSQHEDNSDLKVDISDDVSLDPLVLIANLNKRFKDIRWSYNNKTNRVSIKTRKTPLFYKSRFHWLIYLVFKNQMLTM